MTEAIGYFFMSWVDLKMLALTALWGARLTYNFARKGGYRPGGGAARPRRLVAW